MKSAQLALIELGRKDWSRYRDVRAFSKEPVTSSAYIPETIRGLFTAQTSEEIDERYWQIENHAFVQGNTFEVAEHLIPVLIASLDDLASSEVIVHVLELIFQMVAYTPHMEEVSVGNSELTERCRSRAREGLWSLYRIFLTAETGESDSALNILEVIETDPERLAAFKLARQAKFASS